MACYYYRDADGFCHLVNRCWSGKRCPKDQAAADRAREQLVAFYIAQRDKERDACQPPPPATR